jgi:putative polyketide hydroxylase
MQTIETPVLIAGGGLVGLSAALFLAHQGVTTLVVERRSGTSVHPRARSFDAETSALLAATRAGPLIEGARRDRDPGGRVPGLLRAFTLRGPILSHVGAPPPTGGAALFMGQDRLEPLLLEAARAGGARVLFGSDLLSFHQDAEGVTAEVTVDGRRQRVRARYLVAADGARSGVRAGLDIPMTGPGHLADAASALFRAELTALPGVPAFAFAQITHPEAAGVIVATDQAHRWIFGAAADAPDQPEAWRRRVRLAAGSDDLEVEILSTFRWEVAARVASRFRAGRVFLAGDAAHQMPPTGGYGANTGIQDAANLASRLGRVLQGAAPASLLDGYEAERLPEAQRRVERALEEMRRLSAAAAER